MARTELPAESVDDVILGQGYPTARRPRSAASPRSTPACRSRSPGVQLDRRCGSGLQAVLDAAMQVQTGVADLIIAGGAESMSQAELYSTGLRWGARSGGAMLEDRLVRGRVDGRRGQPSGPRRHDRDRREPAARVPDPARRAGRAGPALPPAGGRRPENGTFRRGDRARRCSRPQERHPPRRARRAPARRRVARDAGLAAPGDGPRGSRRDRHRRQCIGPERRCRGLHRDPRRSRRRARPAARRAARSWAFAGVRAADDGDRPGAGDREGARARRPDVRRPRPDRAQRGVCRAGAGGAARVEAPRRDRARQRQRLGNLARPPDRGDRRPDPGDAAARAGPPWRPYGLETMCIGGGQGLAAVFENVRR